MSELAEQTTPAPVAAPVQDPVAPTAPAAVQPTQPAPVQPAPASQGRPWDADLANVIADPAARAQVSDYLASTWQPRVTQLEQSVRPAKDLWDDFHSKPEETLLEVATDIYGEEGAKAIREALSGNAEPEPEAQPDPDPQPARDPEVEALLVERREARQKTEFQNAFKRTQEAHPEVELDFDLFLPFVGETGDFEQAVERYKQHEAKLATRLGVAVPPPGQPAPTAPPVIGDGAAVGTTAPPQAKQYGSIGEAIEDFADEMRAGGQSVAPAPPPVPVT